MFFHFSGYQDYCFCTILCQSNKTAAAEGGKGAFSYLLINNLCLESVSPELQGIWGQNSIYKASSLNLQLFFLKKEVLTICLLEIKKEDSQAGFHLLASQELQEKKLQDGSKAGPCLSQLAHR